MSHGHDEAYHAHYCEENIYKLAFKYKNLHAEAEDYDSYVVFISNDERKVPLWEQKISAAGKETLWDYHVIFLIRTSEGTTVIDLDSTLGYRVPFDEYVAKTFRPDMPLSEKKHEQMFRVVHADTYLNHFASDRSHMINHDYGATRKSIDSTEGRRRSESTDQYRQRAKSIVYTQPPPSWPPVYGPKADRDMNLDYYISMEPELEESIYGKVMDMKEFINFGK